LEQTSSANSLVANTLDGNGGAGINLDDASTNRVEKNVVRGNNSFGIFVGNGDLNRIVGNRVLNNGGNGIRINSLAAGTLVSANFVDGNAPSHGIEVDSNASAVDASGKTVPTTVAKNIANVNSELGIQATAGVTDGGGNRAFGNGGFMQCDGVVCSP
jgi:parallel beta-helix repeat protein